MPHHVDYDHSLRLRSDTLPQVRHRELLRTLIDVAQHNLICLSVGFALATNKEKRRRKK